MSLLLLFILLLLNAMFIYCNRESLLIIFIFCYYIIVSLIVFELKKLIVTLPRSVAVTSRLLFSFMSFVAEHVRWMMDDE